MENNEVKLEVEQEPKKPKHHPKLGLTFMVFSVVFAIVALIFGIFNELEKLYTAIYAASLLLMLLSFNMVFKMKGFYLIFYPIIMIYALITSYAFDNALLQFQFPIIGILVGSIYFVQYLYEFIKAKDFKKLIFPAIVFIGTVVATSIQTVLDLKYVCIIISSLLVLTTVYELIFTAIDFKKSTKKEVPEEK